jgi:hypothetical protein
MGGKKAISLQCTIQGFPFNGSPSPLRKKEIYLVEKLTCEIIKHILNIYQEKSGTLNMRKIGR